MRFVVFLALNVPQQVHTAQTETDQRHGHSADVKTQQTDYTDHEPADRRTVAPSPKDSAVDTVGFRLWKGFKDPLLAAVVSDLRPPSESHKESKNTD